MTKQLPMLVGARSVAVAESRTDSLVGRGLISIQRGEFTLTIAERDAIYRKARDTYNRITDDGAKNDLEYDKRISGAMWTTNESLELIQIFETFQSLVDAGYGKAYFPLYKFFKGGQCVSADHERARHYANMAFDWCIANHSSNDPIIWNDLGMLLHINADSLQPECVPRNDVAAVKCFRLGAEQGYAWAQWNLSRMYSNGWGVQQDDDEALKWAKLAASQGNACAQHGLGLFYDYGVNAPQDDVEAVRWYRLAAEQGYANAIRALACMCGDGRGVAKDDAEAFRWESSAAAQGHAWAQFGMGVCYEAGMGTQINMVEAIKMYRLAADQGDELARRRLIDLGIA